MFLSTGSSNKIGHVYSDLLAEKASKQIALELPLATISGTVQFLEKTEIVVTFCNIYNPATNTKIPSDVYVAKIPLDVYVDIFGYVFILFYFTENSLLGSLFMVEKDLVLQIKMVSLADQYYAMGMSPFHNYK